MTHVQTILYPTDFDEPAKAALSYALSLARDYGAQLIVLHAVETLGAENVTYGEATSQPQPNAYRERLWKELREWVPVDPQVKIEYLLSEEAAVDAIVNTAAEQHCDLIVIGTHGRRGLDRVLHGSTAEQVVRAAPCPVLVVKPIAHATHISHERS
jgi:universal stress protein A